MRVVFYDIAPSDRLSLASKMAHAAWDKKKAILIRCHPSEVERVDTHLWTFREEAFIPHEAWRPGAPLEDEECRVVLVTADDTPRPADILLQLAPTSLDFAKRFDTVIDVVDHSDEAALAASRARYKAWVDMGFKPDLKKAV